MLKDCFLFIYPLADALADTLGFADWLHLIHYYKNNFTSRNLDKVHLRFRMH